MGLVGCFSKNLSSNGSPQWQKKVGPALTRGGEETREREWGPPHPSCRARNVSGAGSRTAEQLLTPRSGNQTELSSVLDAFNGAQLVKGVLAPHAELSNGAPYEKHHREAIAVVVAGYHAIREYEAIRCHCRATCWSQFQTYVLLIACSPKKILHASFPRPPIVVASLPRPSRLLNPDPLAIIPT